MHCIWTNVAITRRKSYFIVTDPEGRTVFRDRHFWPCVEWLFIEEIERYMVRASEQGHADRVKQLNIHEGQVLWQKSPLRS